MRIAVLVIGLLLGLLLFVQTLLVYVLGSAGSNNSVSEAGAVGLLVALLWLVGAAFAIGVPLLSAIIFAVAGLIAFAISGSFGDMALWGVASLVLAALSCIGFLTKRRGARIAERKLRERDARLASSIRESISTSQLQQLPGNTIFCESCGQPGSATSKFCAECGAPRSGTGASLPAPNR